jgi:hypothetical protein
MCKELRAASFELILIALLCGNAKLLWDCLATMRRTSTGEGAREAMWWGCGRITIENLVISSRIPAG